MPDVGNPFDSLWQFVTAPFAGLLGWGGDKIFEGITNWIAKGCVQLLGYVWLIMDRSTSPHLNAEWFAGTQSSPYQTAARLGAVVLLAVFFLAVCQGVATGDVGGVVRRAFGDLPMTVFAMVSLVTLTQAALGLSDAMSDSVWQGMRTNAVTVFDSIGQVSTKVPGGTFLAPLVLIVLMIALLFLWFVLMLRDVLIYLVVVLAIAFGLPGMVWPTLRGMARHTIELLAALILAKPVIALALSVGVGAMGGVGATGQPGAGAFMPYLVYRLIPVVAAATVAAGVASGPLRAMSTGMQFQYYTQSTMHRLSSGGTQTNPHADDSNTTGASAGSGAATRLAGNAAAGSGVGPAAVVAGVRKVASTAGRMADSSIPSTGGEPS
jgi:hypothetical protein